MQYTVAVRELCEFAAKHGDLDLRFTPAPTWQQGIAGHQAVAARRGAAYRAEVALSGEHRMLRVRGRADGWDAALRCVEEVKTFKGDLARLPANQRELHWAQAKVYGALLCRANGLERITVALVYYDIASRHETRFDEGCDAADLEHRFVALCERFIAWAEQELAHRARRDAALTALAFPHASFRAGQRTLAEAVFRAARAGQCLLAQAPTGSGKTIGTIFPLLKACAPKRLDKVFFLCAKGSGRALALEALQTIARSAPALPLRVVELVAREKVCVYPGHACHGDACPLARGFYDRLAAARRDAVARGTLTRDAVAEVARAHAVCPYYLSQELVRWSDVVVADYNYFFDATALLHALTVANGWRVAVAVDEAHNLVDRARAMYGAELSSLGLRAVRRAAPAALKKPLERLQRAWTALVREQTEPYSVHEQPPAPFVRALQQAATAVDELLAADPQAADETLLRLHFDTLHFLRLFESFGSHSLCDVAVDRAGARRAAATIGIRNVVPAPFLQPRFAAANAAVLLSATLAPPRFHADLLGLPAATAWLDVEAPFDAAQLDVHVVRSVSTRWRDRDASVAPIVRLIAAQYAARRGNYLAFFSSFEYLRRVAAELAACHPEIPAWQQTPQMDERERAAFLERFGCAGDGGIGFAVLGGAFAEGIDLPGRRLVGAFVATLGLPPVDAVHEEMRRRIDALLGSGYEYTYLYPGLRKVVQAAGRVIRTPDDRGSVHLIDDRFARREVRALLPRWWRVASGN